MVGDSVHSAIEVLKAERDRLNNAIASLEGLVPGGAVGGGSGVGRGGARRGRRRGSSLVAAGAGRGRRRGKRKNAPKGLLKKTIHEVLKVAKKPLAPVDLRNAVLKAGYPNRNKKTLYTAIFAATKRDTEVKKTADGFSMK